MRAIGPGVAEGDLAVLVADDDALGEGVEGRRSRMASALASVTASAAARR